MKVLAIAALMPLLVAAVPTAGPLLVQQHAQQQQLQDASQPTVSGFSLDLNELRLVQFKEDEPPVYVDSLLSESFDG